MYKTLLILNKFLLSDDEIAFNSLKHNSSTGRNNVCDCLPHTYVHTCVCRESEKQRITKYTHTHIHIHTGYIHIHTEDKKKNSTIFTIRFVYISDIYKYNWFYIIKFNYVDWFAGPRQIITINSIYRRFVDGCRCAPASTGLLYKNNDNSECIDMLLRSMISDRIFHRWQSLYSALSSNSYNTTQMSLL